MLLVNSRKRDLPPTWAIIRATDFSAGQAPRRRPPAVARTELVVLITPRVIEDPKEWNEIRLGMQGALQNLELPEPTSAATISGGSATPAPAPVPSAQQPADPAVAPAPH